MSQEKKPTTSSAKKTAAKKTAVKKPVAKKATAKKKPAKKGALTTEQMRRIIMRGDGWPHPSYKLAGSGVRFLDDEEAQEAQAQAAMERTPGFQDEADVPMPGERELTAQERALSEDEVAEIVEYEQTLAGGPNA